MKPLTEWWAALDRSHRSALGVAALAVVLLVVVVITSSGIGRQTAVPVVQATATAAMTGFRRSSRRASFITDTYVSGALRFRFRGPGAWYRVHGKKEGRLDVHPAAPPGTRNLVP